MTPRVAGVTSSTCAAVSSGVSTALAYPFREALESQAERCFHMSNHIGLHRSAHCALTPYYCLCSTQFIKIDDSLTESLATCAEHITLAQKTAEGLFGTSQLVCGRPGPSGFRRGGGGSGRNPRGSPEDAWSIPWRDGFAEE